MPDVAVVIGNYRGEHLLPECLASLAAQTLAPSEVVVVDGASPDRSVEVAESLGAYVLRRENRGLGHLYNEGAGATATAAVLSQKLIEPGQRAVVLVTGANIDLPTFRDAVL